MHYKIALVGEAFGAHEASAGKPFVGPSGYQLDSIIRQLGRSRDEFYVTNVVNERPPNNNFGVYYEDKGRKKPTLKLAHNYVRLQHEMWDIKPNVIITLGAEPLKALTDLIGVEKWRGSIINSKAGVKVIPTYHPATLTRGGRTRDGVPIRPIMLWDFKRALRESRSPTINLKERTRLTNAPIEEEISWLDSMPEGKLTVDIETEGNRISCIGLANNSANSICIPFVLPSGERRYEESSLLWHHIRKLLAREDIQVIGQNFAYDLTWLEERYQCPVANYHADTYVQMNCVFPEFPYSLAFMTSLFTDIPYYKDMGKNHKKVRNYENLWNYNCNDVLATFESYERLQSEIDVRELGKMYEFRFNLYRQMHQIARRGIRFDHELRKKMRGESKAKLTKLKKDINKLHGEPINPASPAQLKQWLYQDKGMKPYKNKGSITTDENALKKLAVKYPKDESLPLLMAFRKEAKLYGTYLKVPIDDDQRIRCMYGITETGRLRSSSNPFWTGTNLQNIPQAMRILFLSDQGHLFVEPDLEQAEARVVAYESEDPNLIKLFENGGDIHVINASNIFGILEDQISYKLRQLGKKVAHATNYGMGARTLCESIIKELGTDYAIKESEAKRFQANYHRAYPFIAEWHKRIQQQIRETRTLTNCFGSSILFMADIDAKLFKEAYAWIPQSTVADLLNTGITNYEPDDIDPILLQNHDSVLIQHHEHTIGTDIVIRHITKCFEIPITINEREITIPIDIKTGTNWKEMEEQT